MQTLRLASHGLLTGLLRRGSLIRLSAASAAPGEPEEKLWQGTATTRPLLATVAMSSADLRTSSADLRWPGNKHSQWTSNQAQLIWSLPIIPEPALKRQLAYRIADLPV